VLPPKGDLEHIHYFCGNTEIPAELKEREPQRTALYKATVAFIRAYANIADELEVVGYHPAEIAHINHRRDHYVKLREIIRKASGETIDLKAYEADMRHLLDRYIQADDSVVISPFGDMPLIDVIVKSGIAEAINALPDGIKGNKEAVAETIENNVRSKIIKEQLLDPAYFEKMSKLLAEIIKKRKAKAIEYEEYLQRIADLANQVAAGQTDKTPTTLNTPAKRALYSNLDNNESLALAVHDQVATYSPDNWKGNTAKEQIVKGKIYEVLQDAEQVEAIFEVVVQQSEY